jgi:hypothetical protein
MDIFQKGLHRGAVEIRPKDGTKTVANRHGVRFFKGQPRVEWSKQLIFTEKEKKDSYTALVTAGMSGVDFSFPQGHEMRAPKLTHKFPGILSYLKTVNEDFQDVLLLLKEHQVLFLLLLSLTLCFDRRTRDL